MGGSPDSSVWIKDAVYQQVMSEQEVTRPQMPMAQRGGICLISLMSAQSRFRELRWVAYKCVFLSILLLL